MRRTIDQVTLRSFTFNMYPSITKISLAFLLFVSLRHSTAEQKLSDILRNSSKKESIRKHPTILISIIARNSAHLLPNWLGYLENLDYPKKRISIWIATDHNEDNTTSILKEWAVSVKSLYHRVLINATSSPNSYIDTTTASEWSKSRYLQVAKLRQKALDAARKQWADYLFVIDCDIFMTNPNVLNDLLSENKTLIAPMIEVFGNQSGYSNYWGGIDDDGYYKRTDDYFPVLNREITGCFEFPMIHSTYLLDLRRTITDKLVYYPPPDEYEGEIDDILIFAFSARSSGIKLHLTNKDIYGYMMPIYENQESLTEIQTMFTDAKLEYFVDHPSTLMPVSPHITVKHKKQDKLSFDEIYIINLKRRPLRRKRMEASLIELGIKAKVVDAVDGKLLTNHQIKEMGIKMLPGYADPYSNRPLNMGEIGCFLSHYLIWEEMINNGLKMVLVLEDDIRFQPDFRKKLEEFLVDAENIKARHNWDFIYIGRRRMKTELMSTVEGSQYINWVNYTWWTLGYIINLQGARKLMSAKPLSKLMAVDEFIPVMYDRHPNKTWSSYFNPRNLVAMTAEPLLIYPTHYIGDEGYISDTETTPPVPEDVQKSKEEL